MSSDEHRSPCCTPTRDEALAADGSATAGSPASVDSGPGDHRFVDIPAGEFTMGTDGWSFVFHLFLPDDIPPTRAVAAAPWWRQVEGAGWAHPFGHQSGLEGIGDHPVVHVSWNEARAYCDWAGLHNVAGNAWEWCSDWLSPDFHRTGPRVDPIGPPTGQQRVMRGGSLLCHDSYCDRYKVSARSSNDPDASTGNLGFRVAADA